MNDSIGAQIKRGDIIITFDDDPVIKVHLNTSVRRTDSKDEGYGIYEDVLIISLLNPTENVRFAYLGKKLEDMTLAVREIKIKER